jgi:hypothetical protein
MEIYLISGKAEAGKTTLANYLKEKFELQGKKVCLLRFAEYIKMYMTKYYGWDGKEKTEEIRKKLQWLGTDKIRNQMKKPLFHCIRTCEDIEVLSDDFSVFIIDDTRFANEVFYTQAYFPKQVKTIRINRLGHKSKLNEEQLNHESETQLDKFNFDYTIYTQDGVGHLYDESNRVLRNIL